MRKKGREGRVESEGYRETGGEEEGGGGEGDKGERTEAGSEGGGEEGNNGGREGEEEERGQAVGVESRGAVKDPLQIDNFILFIHILWTFLNLLSS